MTAIERWAHGAPELLDFKFFANFVGGGGLHITYADLRLAADCIAFVRDEHEECHRNDPCSKNTQNCDRHVLAARIKEASEVVSEPA